jgi:hypothetical protein
MSITGFAASPGTAVEPVVDLYSAEQGREPLALGLERSWPGGIVGDDLDQSVTATGPREVFGRGSAGLGGRHLA